MTGPGPQPPDGWIRTPLPPERREDGPDGRDRSWFARNGELVTLHDEDAPEPEDSEPLKLTRVVLWLGLAFAALAAALVAWSL